MATATFDLSADRQPSWKWMSDLILGGALLLLAIPCFVFCWLAVWLTSPGPVLHWSRRVGKDNRVFLMPKFRTMRVDTPQMATHLLQNPGQYLTPIGKLLRKTSLDELPQLLSVLKGDLSLVGPRPALFNQDDLIELRTKNGVHRLLPGITGWAQVNGRDGLNVPAKVLYDTEYMRSRSLRFDLKIMILTLLTVITGQGIRH
jgi:O-antigen biosynthesis protein WbqP